MSTRSADDNPVVQTVVVWVPSKSPTVRDQVDAALKDRQPGIIMESGFPMQFPTPHDADGTIVIAHFTYNAASPLSATDLDRAMDDVEGRFHEGVTVHASAAGIASVTFGDARMA